MIKVLVDLAFEDGEGYGLVLSQSSSEPDTSFYYIERQLKQFTNLPILHIDSLEIKNFSTDSLVNARLIYITGGDQSRFLRNAPTEAQNAIRDAYKKGATVAGTSAGAALMSAVMITGDQKFELEYESTYRRLIYGNGIYESGLGLLDSIIIDQHFVARSRYNRLISALADTKYPFAAGIEESTALVVKNGEFSVVGDGQVIVFRKPLTFTVSTGQIGFRGLNMDAYLHGDTFKLKR
jgi:cyanophycinase